MRFIPWIRGLRLPFSQASYATARRRPPAPALGVVQLEDRITPDSRDVAGLRFFSDSTFAGSSSNATISTNVQVGLVPAAGAAFVPLLNLPGGVTISTSPASATIKSTLSAGGLTFTGNNLAFGFDTPNKRFTVSGDAAFTAGGVTISTSFGTPGSSSPGLVIQNGKLASLDVGVTSKFTVGAVEFSTQDLRLKLDTTAGNRYAISGKAGAAFTAAGNPVSLTTQFGDSASEPGLVIVNGQLTDLTVGVSSSFSVAGVNLQAKDLTLSFNRQANTYALFGSAGLSFKNAAANVGFDLLLGDAAKPGVVIAGGKLQSLNAGVTSNFSVAGVTVNTKALTIGLDVPRNTFTLSGSAGFAFTGAGTSTVNLDVAFGAAGTPGLKIVNGQLTDLSVAVNGGFSVAGLSLQAKSLTFAYNRSLDRFGLSGGVSVSTAPVAGGRRVLDDFGVQLGSAAAPGLVVRSGRLESIDFALNGAINLASLSVTPRNLRVQFARATGVLQFTGGLSVSLASRINASADLTNGGLTINTATGAVQLGGLRLGVTDTRLGPVNIRDAFVAFTNNGNGSFNLSGAAMVELPAGLTVEGSFDLVNGRLRRIMLALSKDPGVPLGNTGVLVNRVAGELNNLDTPAQLQLTGSVSFTGGPSYRIAGRSVALVQGTVGVSLDVGANTLKFSGTVSMVGDFIPLAKGSITFFFNPSNPALSSVQVFVEVNLYNGFLFGTLSLDLSQQSISFLARLAVRIPDITIPEVRFPDVDFGLLGVARGGVVIPATNIGGQELASVEVSGLLDNNNPSQSQLTFRAKLLEVVDATVLVRFNGQLVVSGTALAVPFGPNSYTIPALFTEPNAPPPPPPVRPPTAAPTVRILSAERVAGSPTNDLRVRFQATTAAALRAVQIGFTVNDGRRLEGVVLPDRLDPGQTFDPATGIGTTVIRNPDALAAPGRPFTLTGNISDGFGTSDSAVFGPINPVFGPLTITGSASIVVPVQGQPVLVRDGTIVINDPAAQFDPAARVRVSLVTDSAITLRIPPETLVGSSVTAEKNDGRELVLVGNSDEVNLALTLFTVTRRSDLNAHTIRVTASRVGVFDGAVSRDVAIPAVPPPVVVMPPPDPPTTLRQPATELRPYTGFTTTIPADTQIQVVRVRLLTGTGPTGRARGGFDSLESVIPTGVLIESFYDRGSGELTLAGFLDTETTADFVRAIQGVVFRTSPNTTESGTLTLRLIIKLLRNGRDVLPELVVDERTITIVPQPRLTALRAPGESGLFPSLAAGEQLLVNARSPGGPFTGAGPQVIAPDLTVTDTDEADPVATATVAFTGLFDATSDVMAFTPSGGITGGFDPATGVLGLTGGPSTTLDDFQVVLRGVTFNSTRKNPTPYPREVTFAVTTAAGATSDSRLGRLALDVEVPTVPPDTAGTTTPLDFPPNGTPLAVFPDFDLIYPDAALPPPTVPLGTFIPGSTLTRGSVTIVTNYVPGEDVLTFTPVGAITGTFFANTGELILDGIGTLAEYERVVQSVKYQNKNTSPSTADRLIVVTLDDGSANGNPPLLSRVVRPQSDGLDTIRTSGSLNTLVVTPTTVSASLGLEDLNYAPRPGETELVYTILATPRFSRGEVRLTDGTVAEIGMEVPIEQLRGATFFRSDSPRSGTVPFTFSISGRNPVTGELTETPIVATVPIQTTNVAPTAANDAFRLPAGTPVPLALLDNDSDPNRDLLQVESFTQPANGTVARRDDGSLEYTANAGFAGTDAFRYTITDGAGGRSTATATLTVVAATAPALVGFREFAAGADRGGAATATLFNPDGGPRFTVSPFGSFTGGVRTAAADFNGDGVADLVAGTGPGRATRVVVLDGATQTELFAVDPFEAAFTGGVFVTAGDLNGDGTADLVITPDEGGGPRCRVFSGKGFGQVADFFGIEDTNFRGGARAAVGDITGDGRGDLVVAAGFGGGPRVAVFDGASLAGGGFSKKPFGDFFAFETALRNGTFVAAGDVDGDGKAELIAGGGPGGGPRVSAFAGADLLANRQTRLTDFFAGDVASRGGIRVAVKNLDGDSRADLVAGAGTGAGSRVTGYRGQDLTTGGTPPEALGFDAFGGFAGGVFVG